MDELLKKLTDLQKISAQLEPTQTERDHYLNQIKAWSDQFISKIDQIHAYSSKQPDISQLVIDEKPHQIESLLKIYSTEVTETGIVPSHGGHIGYIPGGGIYLSAVADFLADVSNEYAGMYFGGPGAVAIENELINWMAGIFGFPEGTVGNLTSGGSIANLIALTAARDK